MCDRLDLLPWSEAIGELWADECVRGPADLERLMGKDNFVAVSKDGKAIYLIWHGKRLSLPKMTKMLEAADKLNIEIRTVVLSHMQPFNWPGVKAFLIGR